MATRSKRAIVSQQSTSSQQQATTSEQAMFSKQEATSSRMATSSQQATSSRQATNFQQAKSFQKATNSQQATPRSQNIITQVIFMTIRPKHPPRYYVFSGAFSHQKSKTPQQANVEKVGAQNLISICRFFKTNFIYKCLLYVVEKSVEHFLSCPKFEKS